MAAVVVVAKMILRGIIQGIGGLVAHGLHQKVPAAFRITVAATPRRSGRIVAKRVRKLGETESCCCVW